MDERKGMTIADWPMAQIIPLWPFFMQTTISKDANIFNAPAIHISISNFLKLGTVWARINPSHFTKKTIDNNIVKKAVRVVKIIASWPFWATLLNIIPINVQIVPVNRQKIKPSKINTHPPFYYYT
jgi:hypothetical protein